MHREAPPEPVPSRQENTGVVPAEGRARPGRRGLRPDFPPGSHQSEGEVVPWHRPDSSWEARGRRGAPGEEGGAGPAVTWSVSPFSPERAEGRGGQTSPGRRGGPSSAPGAFPALLFLSRLPFLHQPLVLLLLPGGGFPRRRPAFLGAEAVGPAAWRPPVPQATWPPPSAHARAEAGVGAGRGSRAGTWAPLWLPWERVGCGCEGKAVMAAGRRRGCRSEEVMGFVLMAKPRPGHGGLHSCPGSVPCFVKDALENERRKYF